MEISFSFVGLQSHIGNQIVILPKSVLRFFHSLQYKLPRSLGFSLQERLLKNDTTESCCEQASNQAYREFLGVKRIVQYIFSMTINKGLDSMLRTVGSNIHINIFLKTFIGPIIHPL